MERNGWKLYWHPAFRQPFEKLFEAVEVIKQNRPAHLSTNGKDKLLRRTLEIILDEIPEDPNHSRYVQGNKLTDAHRHWRRAKFFQRFRLFFRFSSSSKIIIYAWVNDENTLRQADGKKDPYEIFKRRLKQRNPATDWDDLLTGSEELAETRIQFDAE